MADARRTIIVLLAVLGAAVIVSVGIMYVLPSQREEAATPTTSRQIETLDTSALQRTPYTQINTGLIQQGALPVPPPPGAGKANPFL